MKNTTIYSEDGIKIEATTSKKSKIQEPTFETDTLTTKETPKLTKEEYLLTLATYLNDPYMVIPVSRKATGKCVICGIETNRAERKICPACLREHNKELFNEYEDAVMMGSDFIEC